MGHIKKSELTQEEKELLEVIGKGTGAGLVSGRCTPGGRALRSLDRASGPEDLGQLAIRKKPFCLWLGTDCRGGEMEAEHCDQIWVADLRPLNQLFGNRPTVTTRLRLSHAALGACVCLCMLASFLNVLTVVSQVYLP